MRKFVALSLFLTPLIVIASVTADQEKTCRFSSRYGPGEVEVTFLYPVPPSMRDAVRKLEEMRSIRVVPFVVRNLGAVTMNFLPRFSFSSGKTVYNLNPFSEIYLVRGSFGELPPLMEVIGVLLLPRYITGQVLWVWREHQAIGINIIFSLFCMEVITLG